MVAVVLRGGVLEVVEVVFIGKSRLADVSLSLFSIGFVVTDDGEAFDVELAADGEEGWGVGLGLCFMFMFTVRFRVSRRGGGPAYAHVHILINALVPVCVSINLFMDLPT